MNEVVLVEVSTPILKNAHFLTDLFTGKELWKLIKIDEAVEFGARVQTAILANSHKSENISLLLLLNISLLSLGLEPT